MFVVVVVVVPEAVNRGLPMLMFRLVITGRWSCLLGISASRTSCGALGSAAGSSARKHLAPLILEGVLVVQQ